MLASCSSNEDDTEAGIDESFLDRRVDPCTDFHQFACGTWIREHSAPAGYVQSRFYESDNRSDIYYDRLIKDSTYESDGIAKARQYYASCVRAGETIAGDSGAMADQIGAITDIVTPADLAKVLASLHAANVHALFYANPGTDPSEPDRRVIALWDSGWSLPTKESYVDAARNIGIAYERHIQELTRLLGSTLATAPMATWPQPDPTLVFRFESSVAHPAPSRRSRSRGNAQPHRPGCARQHGASARLADLLFGPRFHVGDDGRHRRAGVLRRAAVAPRGDFDGRPEAISRMASDGIGS